MHKLLHTSKLFDPYQEAVNLSFVFTQGGGKTEDRTKVFTSPLFEELLTNKIDLRDILNKDIMHDNTNITKKLR